MSINLILARDVNGVIGDRNRLPWSLPEDMEFFREQTCDGIVLMGRKTWDSLSPRFRPLPGRRNLVVTHQPDFSALGAEVFDSLTAALNAAAAGGDVWVIGGASIYAQALPHAQRVLETVIHSEFAGDAFAPEITSTEWGEPCVIRSAERSSTGLSYSIREWRRPASTHAKNIKLPTSSLSAVSAPKLALAAA